MKDKLKQLNEENRKLKTEIEELKKTVKELKTMYYELGNRFFNVDKVDNRDEFYKDAFDWYARAALNEDAYAYNMLGSMYRHGYYVKQDKDRALKNYKMAAKLGSVDAQYFLGFCHSNGGHLGDITCDVEKDQSEAFKWYKMAAERGNVTAAYYIGVMYYEGSIVNQNLEEAEKWLTFACHGGHEGAKKYLNKINGIKTR